MKRIIFAMAALGLFAVSGTADAAGLGDAAELEHARANARAGGPLSERDKELLERGGCLSGTEHPFCAWLEGRWDRDARRHHRRHRY